MTDEMKENDATRYMVIRLETAVADGKPTLCVISCHVAEGDAQKAAQECAMKDEHDRAYAVMQKVGTAKAAREVTWKGARP